MSDKERKLRELEILLIEKKLELLEVRVNLFGLRWREQLSKLRMK